MRPYMKKNLRVHGKDTKTPLQQPLGTTTDDQKPAWKPLRDPSPDFSTLAQCINICIRSSGIRCVLPGNYMNIHLLYIVSVLLFFGMHVRWSDPLCIGCYNKECPPSKTSN